MSYEPYLSTDYREHLSSPEWKIKAHVLRAVVQSRCEWCGTEDSLDVHHVHYRTFRHEQPQDLVVLCRRCHRAAHDSWESPTRDDLREIASRHPETFDEILESERFEGTYL